MGSLRRRTGGALPISAEICLDPAKPARKMAISALAPRNGAGYITRSHKAERGAARLAHRSGGPGVAGSNPAAPTKYLNGLRRLVTYQPGTFYTAVDTFVLETSLNLGDAGWCKRIRSCAISVG